MAEPKTLKVELDGDLRRFRLRLEDADSPAEKIRAIHFAISDGFSLGEVDPPLILKYKDEDGDACTLVAATIEDFLAQAEPGAKPLRLTASKAAQSHAASKDPPCNESGSVVAVAASASLVSTAACVAETNCAAASTAVSSSMRGTAADGCHSVGPWKLLMCLRGLHEADMMSCKMVGSMLLQFLPILAQRTHRKQEKLNKLGPQMREALLSLLHSVSAHLDLIEEAHSVKPMLEEFITGTVVSRLGDCVAALFKALSTCKDRHAVSEAIVGVAPELLESLPKLFPDLFASSSKESADGLPEHCGTRCSACSREPIKGPRFHCAEARIDLCGECFIDQGCEADQQFQCFFAEPSSRGAPSGSASCSWRDQAKAWKDQKCDWKKDMARKKGEFCKGKGKGKGKGKWWFGFQENLSADAAEARLAMSQRNDAAEEGASPSVGSDSMAGSDAGTDFAPPGLEQPNHGWPAPWMWQGGKGHKGKGWDWASQMAPWGPWEASMMHHPFPPHIWPHWDCTSWAGNAHWSGFDNAGVASQAGAAPVCSEGRPHDDAKAD